MAGVVVPLITALAPDIIKLIVGLVHKSAPVAEATNGPGTGAVKFAQVFQDVIMALQSAAAAGTIDKALPADETVKMIIQAVVTSMQAAGLLPGSAIVTPPSPSPQGTPQQIWLMSGQSIVIGVK